MFGGFACTVRKFMKRLILSTDKSVKKYKEDSGYKINFYNKYIARIGANIKKVGMIKNFVDWFFNSNKDQVTEFFNPFIFESA